MLCFVSSDWSSSIEASFKDQHDLEAAKSFVDNQQLMSILIGVCKTINTNIADLSTTVNKQIAGVTSRLDALESVIDSKLSYARNASAPSVTVLATSAALENIPESAMMPVVQTATSILNATSFVQKHPQPTYTVVKGDFCTLMRDWHTKHLSKAVWQDHKQKQMMERVLSYLDKNEVLSGDLRRQLDAPEPKNTLSVEHDLWETSIATAASAAVKLLLLHLFKSETEIACKANNTPMPSDTELPALLRKRKFSDRISGIDSRIAKLNTMNVGGTSSSTVGTLTKFLVGDACSSNSTK